MDTKQLSRRGFIAAAALGAGGMTYAHEQGNSNADYDKTIGSMLANKLLAELEPIAVYQIGKTIPVAYMYHGYDKQCCPVASNTTEFDITLCFEQRGKRMDITASYSPHCPEIEFSSVKFFKKRYRPKKHECTVSCWNCDAGSIDNFRRKSITNAFKNNFNSKGFSIVQKQQRVLPPVISTSPL